MSLESSFLDIYETVLKEGFDEFYSSDISEHMNMEPGNVGNTVHRTLEKYDLPIDVERDDPRYASLFIVEERLNYSEMEDILDPEPADLVDDAEEAAKEEVLDRLDSRQYTDPELLSVLGEAVKKHYDGNLDEYEVIGRLKGELKAEGVLNGSMINGWTVKSD